MTLYFQVERNDGTTTTTIAGPYQVATSSVTSLTFVDIPDSAAGGTYTYTIQVWQDGGGETATEVRNTVMAAKR